MAILLSEWLPLYIPNIETFVSSKDIRKGEGWSPRIQNELASADAALIVVTSANVSSPWLHYEAGALAQSTLKWSTNANNGEPIVCPFLVDVPISSIASTPLSQFQCTQLTVADMCRLARDLVQVTLPNPIDYEYAERLRKVVATAAPPFIADIEVVVSEQKNSRTAETKPLFDQSYTHNSEEFISAINSATRLNLCGFAHNRMSVSYSSEIGAILERSGSVRVLAMDPDGRAVMDANFRSSTPKSETAVRHQHRAGLATLGAIFSRYQAKSEIRLFDFMPPFVYWQFEFEDRPREAFVWFAPFRQPSSFRPGVRITESNDGDWLGRFASQFESIWELSKRYEFI